MTAKRKYFDPNFKQIGTLVVDVTDKKAHWPVVFMAPNNQKATEFILTDDRCKNGLFQKMPCFVFAKDAEALGVQ